MPIDFEHIPVNTRPGVPSPSLTFDQLLSAAASFPSSDPRSQLIHREAERLDNEARALCRKTLKGLVPRLEELESSHATDPARLRVEILKQVEAKLSEIEHQSPGALKQIGMALGQNPDLFRSPEDFKHAVAQVMLDRLNPPAHLGEALNVLSSGNLLKHLVKLGSLASDLLEKLDELFLAGLALTSALFNASTPGPFLPPSRPGLPAPTILSALLPINFQNTGASRVSVREELQLAKKDTPLFEVIAEACNRLAEDSLKKQEALKKDERMTEDDLRKKRDEALEDFASLYPELKEELKELLGDQHFTDGPITRLNKLLALQQVERMKYLFN